jgi:hypothetical protein
MHTSDLFHKQPWSDGLVNIYDQLGVDYYENKYRWVLGGDGGGDGDGDDQVAGLYDAEGGTALRDLGTDKAGKGFQTGDYHTAEEAHSFLGNLTGARGTDQEYADARAAQAALESGLPTFVDTRGITQNLRDGMPEQPGDYLGDAIAEFNRNPSINISPLNLLSLAAKSNPLTAVATTAASVGARALGMPDLLTIDREGVDTPLGRALAEQVTGSVTSKEDGGPIVPQGGIGNFYGR